MERLITEHLIMLTYYTKNWPPWLNWLLCWTLHMQISHITTTPKACEAHEFTLGVLDINGILTFPGGGDGKSQRV